MRIIGQSFHDYYDSVQGVAYEPEPLYVRNREEVQEAIEFPTAPGYYWSRRVSQRLSIEEWIVGFCGKIYPVLKLHIGSNTVESPNPGAFCFSLQDVDAYMVAHLKERELNEYYLPERKGRHTIRRRYWPAHYNHEAFKEYFDECAAKQDAFKEMFLAKHCPIFVAQPDKRTYLKDKKSVIPVVYNENLKDLHFFRLFDTFRAFQEISMFLGGMALSQKPMPITPDPINAESHGFDKWSFRKEPTKKRRK